MQKSWIVLTVFMLSVAMAWAVPFSLLNRTGKSIPLSIPGVMNPNLSPFSRSGVDLEVGQKVYFYHKRKKYLLFEVTEDYRDQDIIVNQVIKERKAELGLD